MSGFLDDLVRAARGVGRAPGFSAVVISTVALGIGATTAMFSVVHAVLLAPLPYPDPDRIVSVSEQIATSGNTVLLSYVNGRDFKQGQTTFEAIALSRAGALTLDRGEGAPQLSALFADAEYFDVFDARPAVGRVFGTDENRVPGGHPVAVLTFEAWQRHFGADPGIVGASVSLSGTPFTIVGVLAEDFREPFTGVNGGENDVVVPAVMAGQVDPRGDDVVTVRRWRTFSAVGRLRPEATVAGARADLRRIARSLEELFPVNRGMSAEVVPFADLLTQSIRNPALTLLVGALVLLAIAVFNVANLLLIRGSFRSREMGVLLALGAGRPRVFRYLLLQGLVLALAGGALGVAAAGVMMPTLLGLAPAQLPPAADVRLSLPVLGAALALSLAAGAGFGLLPALRVSGIDLRASLACGTRAVGDRTGERVRHGLVLFEIATATTLLAASVLLVGSFHELTSADSGFETEEVLTMQLNLPAARYEGGASMVTAIEEVVDRVADVSGVAWAHPWGPGRPGLTFSFQTSVPDHMVVDEIAQSPLARRHGVSPGALNDLGIELVRGRGIEETDRADTPPVAVVSESLARELWPDEDPIGKRYHNFQPPGQPVPEESHWTVVGVVRDANHGGRVPAPGAIGTDNDSYFPIAQRPERSFTLLVKTDGLTDHSHVRDAIRDTDPGISITQVATMQELFAAEEGTPRFAAQLMGSFGIAALFLAAMGVYGVMSFTVARRRREIGLRSALGAARRDTLRHFMRRGLLLAGAGVLVGSTAAYGAARTLRAVLPNVPSMNGVAVIVAAGLLLLVALVSTSFPALRATRIQPVVALKEE